MLDEPTRLDADPWRAGPGEVARGDVPTAATEGIHSSTLMDWNAIAEMLAGRSSQPVVLLDQTGRIRLINQATERALGWTRTQVEGQHWASAFAPGGDDGWIAEALRGARRTQEVIARTGRGGRMALSLEFTLVGGRAARGLVVTVARATPVESAAGPFDGQDLEYEVTLPSFDVTRLSSARGPVPLAPGQRCWAVIHGRDARCEACPLARNDGDQTTLSSARYSGTRLELKIAEHVDAARARVRHRLLPEGAIDALNAARVEKLASRARLTARERELLEYVLLGRSIQEIAEQLEITRRTVKFHQANILEKLGADSRVDLLRVLL